MLFSSLVSLLALAAGALARPGHKGHNKNDNTPSPPPTDYLFTVNITSGEVVVLGDTPAGERTFQPIIGGTFSGPKLQGQVVGGLDYGLINADGNFVPQVVYLLRTSDEDECDVLVTETGRAPNVLLEFETACDKYDWLNAVVAYGLATRTEEGVSVAVWQVGVYSD